MYEQEATDAMTSHAARSGFSSMFNQLSDSQKLGIFKAGLWELYSRTKSKSYKFSIGPIPVSIKIEKIRPLLVWWIGEPLTPV